MIVIGSPLRPTIGNIRHPRVPRGERLSHGIGESAAKYAGCLLLEVGIPV